LGGFVKGGNASGFGDDSLSIASGSSKGGDRKMGAIGGATMKTKWLKAFKSLKTTTGPGAPLPVGKVEPEK